jgi:hypothetical protein
MLDIINQMVYNIQRKTVRLTLAVGGIMKKVLIGVWVVLILAVMSTTFAVTAGVMVINVFGDDPKAKELDRQIAELRKEIKPGDFVWMPNSDETGVCAHFVVGTVGDDFETVVSPYDRMRRRLWTGWMVENRYKWFVRHPTETDSSYRAAQERFFEQKSGQGNCK